MKKITYEYNDSLYKLMETDKNDIINLIKGISEFSFDFDELCSINISITEGGLRLNIYLCPMDRGYVSVGISLKDKDICHVSTTDIKKISFSEENILFFLNETGSFDFLAIECSLKPLSIHANFSN